MTRRRVYQLVSPAAPGDKASKAVDAVIVTLILVSVVAIVLASEASILRGAYWSFVISELVIVGVFTVEYIARMWSCVENPSYEKPVTGRLRYAVRFESLVDLAAILPFFLPMLGIDLRMLRLFRALRLLRILKLGRYSRALRVIGAVLKRRREELLVSVGIVGVLMVIASCLMYFAETEAQPEVFGSIPDAMWWAIVTLTTVGYGDAYPITAMGKVVAATMSILAIGLVALPTGILGSAFIEELDRDPNITRNRLGLHGRRRTIRTWTTPGRIKHRRR